MIVQNNLVKCTVRELANYLAEKTFSIPSIVHPFSACDFSVIDDPAETDLKSLYDGARGWFGVKAIDTGFDSCYLTLASDYYGGGCLAICTIEDMVDDSEESICEMLKETLSYDDYYDESTLLIVEFLYDISERD